MPKIKIVCPKCGSDDVCRDGVLRWSVEAQEWEKCSEFDDMTCQACGYEGHSFDEKEVGDNYNAADHDTCPMCGRAEPCNECQN